MSVGLLFTLIVGLLALGGFAVGVLLARSGNSPRLDRLDRAERARLEAAEELIETLRELAYENRDLDPNLSDIFIDEIKKSKHKRKELG